MDALAFWLSAVATWAIALPIAAALMRRLPDAGAGVALPLGLVIAGLSYYLLRVASVVPAGEAGWLSGIFVLAFISGLVLRHDAAARARLRRSWPAALAVFGLFTCLFFVFAWFRSHVAAIADTEQPMDFMYLNAMLASPDYPPHDPWFAGEAASYYYFGYLQMALLTAISGVASSTGYNLALATTFAAAGTGVASLSIALVRWAAQSRRGWVGLAASFGGIVLLLGVGSLSAPFEWAAAHGHTNETLYRTFGVQWMIPCTPEQLAQVEPVADCYRGQLNPRTTAWYPTEYWFWWRGTRIIPETITEYPFFSFLLGDLHPHVMAIPGVLLAVGLAMVTARGRDVLSLASHRKPWRGVALDVVLGSLAFMNAWDVITFCALLAAAAAMRNVRLVGWGRGLRATAGWVVPIFALSVVAYLPWYVTFNSQASGIYPYVEKGTIPAHAILQFGIPVVLLVATVPFMLRGARPGPLTDALAAGLWAPLLPLLAWLLFAAGRGELSRAVADRTGLGWATLLGYAAVLWLLASAWWYQLRRQPPLALVAGLSALGVLLLYGTELFYVGDIFRGSIPRQNTVFKLSYQAWIVFAVAAPAAVAWAIRAAARAARPLAAAVAFPALALVGAGLIYPVLSLPNRTNGFENPRHTDGLAFLAESQPGEYALVRWVDEHVPGDAIVVEATGRRYRVQADGTYAYDPTGPRIDYGEPGRVSARTGRQAPIGWPGHEVQWRGTNGEVGAEINRRQELVDRLYLATDPAVGLDLMRQLGAQYVVVGRIERDRYPLDLDGNFSRYLDVVFDDEATRVYAMPRFQLMETS